jgi:hypothetical protein
VLVHKFDDLITSDDLTTLNSQAAKHWLFDTIPIVAYNKRSGAAEIFYH